MDSEYQGPHGGCSKCSSAAPEDGHIGEVLVSPSGGTRSGTFPTDVASDCSRSSRAQTHEEHSPEKLRRAREKGA